MQCKRAKEIVDGNKCDIYIGQVEFITLNGFFMKYEHSAMFTVRLFCILNVIFINESNLESSSYIKTKK